MLSMITAKNTIRSGHLVRQVVSHCSSGAVYYSTKWAGVEAFSGALAKFDLHLDRDDISDFYGNEGRKTIAIHTDDDDTVGHLILMWYWLGTRYEFIGYIS